MPLVTKENINENDLLIVFAPKYIVIKNMGFNKHEKIKKICRTITLRKMS